MRPADLGPVLVTGGGGFLGTALIKLLVQRGLAVRSLSRRLYPHLQELGVEQVPGDVADPQVVDRAVEGCQTDLSYRGQGGHLGLGPGVRADQRSGHSQRDRGLPGAWLAANHLQQLAQRGVQRPGHGRGRRVGSLFGTIRGRLPRDQGPRRADHPRGPTRRAWPRSRFAPT